MTETVIHINQEQKYRVIFDRAAVKDRDGFKVEANGDDIESVKIDAEHLLRYAQEKTEVKKE